MNIAPMIIGKHTVTFTSERTGPNHVKIIATSDTGGSANGVMTLHPKHDHTEEQFLIDVKEFATRLAEEAAGHAQSQHLLDKHF
jgi:hypothetical protein